MDGKNIVALIFFFFFKFQSMDQHTNRFLVQTGMKLQISYTSDLLRYQLGPATRYRRYNKIHTEAFLCCDFLFALQNVKPIAHVLVMSYFL